MNTFSSLQTLAHHAYCLVGAKIENILLKISELAEKYPNIKELDINPLIANNEKIVIADARIILE